MKYSYCEEQLKAAIDFIAEYNQHKFSKQSIYNSIRKSIESYYDDDGVNYVGTMGYIVMFEKMDDDVVHCHIYIDPSVDVEKMSYITVNEDGTFTKEYAE